MLYIIAILTAQQRIDNFSSHAYGIAAVITRLSSLNVVHQ